MQIIIDSINNTYRINNDTKQQLVSSLQPLRIPKRAILIEPNKRDNNIYLSRRHTLLDLPRHVARFTW